jgi:fibronectin-binding autotransporter adhesin
MKRSITAVAALLILTMGISTAQAVTYYWDRDDNNVGALPADAVPGDGKGDGFWDTTALNWSTDPNGSGANVAWVDGSDAVFSASNDLVGQSVLAFPFDSGVTITGTRTANSVTIEEGIIKFLGGTADTAANAVTVKTNATLIIDNTARINTGAGKLVLEGGTLINANTGTAGTFLGTGTNGTTGDGGGLKPIEINGIGYIGYNDGDGVPDNKVSIFSGVILGVGGTTTNGGAGTLVKIGPDQFGLGVSDQDFVAGAPRIHSQTLMTFAKLVVKEGGYRLRNTTQDTTARETGFGAVPLTELADAITLDGGGIGTSATVTLDTKRGITVLNSAGNNLGVLSGSAALGGGYWDHGAGANIVAPGPLSGGGNLYVGNPTSTSTSATQLTLSHANNVNTFTGGLVGVRGTLLLNSSLKVAGLKDVSGFTQNPANNATITVSTGNTLTIGTGNGTDTWSRPITGAGSLTKVGTGTQNLTGAPTYSGDTKVEGGTLSIASSYLANAADVYVSGTGIFDLNFAGTDTIDQLFLNGLAQTPGIWGSAASGAANISALFTGLGTLTVITGAGPVGVDGDYNDNGVVDAADYVVWRNAGPTATLPHDPSPGVVDITDYNTWRGNFNKPNSGSGSGAAVPEPTSIVLVFASLIGMTLTGRRTR